MAQVKITALSALTAADSAATDVLPIVDVSADATKKLAVSDLHRSVPDGTLSAPGIAFQSDLNSGLYRSGTDAIALVTNGAARILIDATGNVTIPNNLTVQGATTNTFTLGTAAAPSINFINDSDTGLYSPSANQVAITTAGDERLRIDNLGRLLVGGTSITENDHANIDANGTLTIRRSSGGAVYVKKQTATRLYISADGGVNSFNNALGFISYDATFEATSYRYAQFVATSSEAQVVAGAAGSLDTPIVFKTSSSGTEAEAMKIEGSGIVKIGTANTSSAIALIGSSSNNNFGQLQLQTSGQFLIGYGSTHSVQPNQLSLKNNVGDLTFYTDGDERLKITSTGSAEFKGSVLGSNIDVSSSSGKNGWKLSGSSSTDLTGKLELQCKTGASGNTKVFEVFNGSTSTSSIAKDGSAEFASNIDSGDGVSTSSTTSNGSRVSPGQVACQRPASESGPHNKQLYRGFYGTNEVFKVNLDGSATFAGPQTLATASSPATNGYTSHVDNTVVSTAACFTGNNHNADGIIFLGVDGGNSNAITTTIKNDGSATFAGEVKGPSVKAQPVGVNSYSLMDGTGIFQTNTSGSTSISLTANGNATFAGDIKNGDPTPNGAGGTRILVSDAGTSSQRGRMSLYMKAGGYSGSESFEVYTGSTRTALITASGAATFAGPTKGLYFQVTRTGTTQTCFEGLLNTGGSLAQTSIIRGNGSATFAAGNIDFSVNGAATFNSIVRVKDQSGSTDKIVLDNNGSATFAGDVKYGGFGYISEGDLGTLYSGSASGSYGIIIGTEPGSTSSAERKISFSLGAGGASEVASIGSHGSAEFAGDVTVKTAKKGIIHEGDFTLANNANTTIECGISGMVQIAVKTHASHPTGNDDYKGALFYTSKGAASVTKIADPGGHFDPNQTTLNTGKINVASSAGATTITITNKTGYSVTLVAGKCILN